MTIEQPTAAPSSDEGLYDAKGRWVPLRLIADVDLARHELVVELIERAKKTSAMLAAFKVETMRDIAAFVELSAEKYDVHLGGHKGNVTLTSFSGNHKIVRAMADRLTFDERLLAAKALVDECILEWTEGSRDELRALVEHAFSVDKQGKISTERVLALRRLEIDSEKWQRAVRAIGESIQVASTSAYVRFYERVGDSEQYQPIPLDLATVPTPEETER